MNTLFIETSAFTRWVVESLDDEAYAALQQRLIGDPTCGDVMVGCGGLRKLRIALPSRGKRGGARVIYLHVPEANWIFFIDAYRKGVKEDLSNDEKKGLKRLAEQFAQEARKKTSTMGKEKRR